MFRTFKLIVINLKLKNMNSKLLNILPIQNIQFPNLTTRRRRVVTLNLSLLF